MMKITDIPFNMKYSMLDNLKEEADDIGEMNKGILFILEKANEQSHQVDRASLLSLAGTYQRITWQLEESEKSLKEAYQIFKDNRVLLSLVVSTLRLGSVYHWMGKYAKAEKLITQALDICSKSSAEDVRYYLSFAYQQLGKCKYDQHLYNEAEKYFLKSLDLRILLGDMDLIESTRQALKINQQKLSRLP